MTGSKMWQEVFRGERNHSSIKPFSNLLLKPFNQHICIHNHLPEY